MIEGLIAASYTPMNLDGRLNLGLIKELYINLKNQGCTGVLVNGTTGESMSLTAQERVDVLELWVKSVDDSNFKVLVNVGNESIEVAKELARHAANLNITGFCCNAPSFFRPASVTQLVSFCSDVAESGSKLPFYFYHLPCFTNVTFNMIDFIKEAERNIPNFTGLKFTDFNFMDLFQCLEYKNSKFNILLGRDEVFLPALSIGCKGGIGSTYNFIAPVYNKVKKLFESGNINEARKEFLFAVNVISLMNKYGGLPAGKAIMKMIGIDCGSLRKPCLTLTNEEQKMFKNDLDLIGFFDRRALV